MREDPEVLAGHDRSRASAEVPGRYPGSVVDPVDGVDGEPLGEQPAERAAAEQAGEHEQGAGAAVDVLPDDDVGRGERADGGEVEDDLAVVDAAAGRRGRWLRRVGGAVGLRLIGLLIRLLLIRLRLRLRVRIRLLPGLRLRVRLLSGLRLRVRLLSGLRVRLLSGLRIRLRLRRVGLLLRLPGLRLLIGLRLRLRLREQRRIAVLGGAREARPGGRCHA